QDGSHVAWIADVAGGDEDGVRRDGQRFQGVQAGRDDGAQAGRVVALGECAENVVADRRRLTTPRFELTDRAAGDLACQQPGRVDQQLYRRLTLQRAEHDANPFDVEGAFLL